MPTTMPLDTSRSRDSQTPQKNHTLNGGATSKTMMVELLCNASSILPSTTKHYTTILSSKSKKYYNLSNHYLTLTSTSRAKYRY